MRFDFYERVQLKTIFPPNFIGGRFQKSQKTFEIQFIFNY